MNALQEVSGAGELSDAAYGKQIVLADFYTPACVICRKLEPMLIAVAEEFSDTVAVRKVNAEAIPDLAVSCAVRGVPSLVLLKDGEVVDRKVGFVSATDLRQWLRGHLS